MSKPNIGLTENIDENTEILLGRHGFKTLSDVPVQSITVNETKWGIDDKNRRTALIIFDLSVQVNTDGVLNKPFHLTLVGRAMIRMAYGPHVCAEVTAHAREHMLGYSLLHESEVIVSVELTPDH